MWQGKHGYLDGYNAWAPVKWEVQYRDQHVTNILPMRKVVVSLRKFDARSSETCMHVMYVNMEGWNSMHSASVQ